MILRPYRLPFVHPLRTAAGTFTHRSGLVVELDGARGDVAPLPGFSAETLDQARDAVEAWDGGALPAVPSAAHGIEQALLTADATRRGVPLAAVLAPDFADAVPVNAVVRDASDARDAVRRGFSCLKVKVGYDDLDADVVRVGAIRDAAPDAALRLDANGAWSPTRAADAVRRLAPLGIAAIEQPVAAVEDLAALRGLGVPIAADESCRTPSDLERILALGAADAVVLKPMLTGLSTAVAMGRRARGEGLAVWVTTSLESAVGRTAALHVAAAIGDVAPCGLDTGRLLARDLAPGPLVEDGWMRIS